MVNPQTGRVYRTNIDPATGKIASPNDVYSPSAMINPGNLVDLKVNLDDQIDPFLKRLEKVGVAKNLGNGVIEVDESARNNPAFKSALDAQINAVTATPRSTTSILTDYVGDYQFFESEAQKKELISKGTPVDKLIQVQRKNGIAEPILTEAQEKVAKDFVRNQIEVGVGGKESLTKPFAPKTPRSSGGGRSNRPEKYTQGEETILAKGDQVMEIMDDIALRGDNTQYKRDILNAAYDMGVGFGTSGALTPAATLRKNKNGGVDVIDKADANSPYAVVLSVKSPQELYSILGGGDALSSRAEWGKYQQLSQGAMGYTSQRGKAPAPAPISKAVPQAKLAPKQSGDVKIVSLNTIKQKLGKDATQSKIDAYIKQLESGGKFKVEGK
jgi:hypothetical protein